MYLICSHPFIAEGVPSNQDRDQHSSVLTEDLELPSFDLDTIVNATNNFSSTNKLGEGGFGAVYKVK